MTKLHLINKMGRIYLTWTRKLQRELVPHEITLKQQFVLRQLEKAEYLYPYQIAEMLYCDRPTATVIIKNIQKNGWVEKEKDPENLKRFRVFITESGRRKVQSLENITGPDALDRYDPLSVLTVKERETLDRLMNKVLKHIDG